MSWSLGDKLALAALVVTVVGIPVTIWATRKYGNRRRRLLFEWHATPLIPEGHGRGSSELALTYRDLPVQDPYLLVLRLVNVGPADVASEHFDAGRSVVIRLNCVLYGLLGSTASHTGLASRTPAVGADGYVEVLPGLLQRGATWSVEVVVSGEPDPQLDSPLVDTDVIDAPTYKAQLASNLVLRLAGLTLGVRL